MPSQWRKPNRVEVRDREILADFSRGVEYPLARAMAEGKKRQAHDTKLRTKSVALQELSLTRSDEDIQKFVKKWGLLVETIGTNVRYPVLFFRTQRALVIGLARLATALHRPTDRPGAVRKFWQDYDPLRAGEAVPSMDGDPTTRLTDQEKQRVADGVPWYQVARERLWQLEHPNWPLVPPGAGYIAHLLAQFLGTSTHLEVMRHGQRWDLQETPQVTTLLGAMLWSIRTQLGVTLYRVCERCKEGFVPKRPDQRYCVGKCGNQARVQKYRRKRAKGRGAGGRRGVQRASSR